MHRVRIGLTGLGLVFLLVLIGAVIRSASNDEQPAAAKVAGQSPAPDGPANDEAEPTEPLAQLGVAPGNADPPNAAAAAPPATGK